VVFFIISDDLTGASGVASMVDHSTAVTVNLDRFGRALTKEFGCIVLNLESREKSGKEAARRLSRALDLVGESPVALRIDSALRGRVRMLVEAMLQRGAVLITDTIPDYGRSTQSGKTVIGAQRKDIESLLEPLRRRMNDRGLITVADSQTYDDLDRLARTCIEDDLIPVDPGPLVAAVARTRLGLDARTSSPSRKRASKVAFVVGTRDPRTLEQLGHMGTLGFPIQKPAAKRPEDVDLFVFSMEKDKGIITQPFLEHLAKYDALVLSGGATANHVLARSGFRYLQNDGQVQPLVSSGIVMGGVLGGKRVVLKGGFIGDEKTYKTILDWLRKG
jgi:D-threonate/D-erythronate kinase